MTDFIRKDADARDRIVNDTGTNFFVEAGAGSGKTTMLVRRMVAMVETGTDISTISAITFTKAAAGEFYSRFQKMLIKRSSEEADDGGGARPGELCAPTEETRRRCREALENIDLCFMGTIDSFCNMILCEHPAEAGVPSSTRVVSDDEMKALCLREYSRIQKGIYGDELKRLNTVFRALHYRPDDVFIAAVRMLMEHRNVSFIFPEEPASSVGDTFSEEKAELTDLVGALLARPDLAYDKKDASRKAWKTLRDKGDMLDGMWDNDIPRLTGFLNQFGNLRLKLDADLNVLGLCGTEFFEKHTSKNGLGWYEIKKERLDPIVGKLEDYRYSLTMHFAEKCVGVISEALRKEGALSYFDYMLYLRNMLAEDAAGGGKLIRHIAERHSRFLIDEFQDTDPMQAEIFFYLAAEEPKAGWRDCVPRPGSLFIVGDPKQSIYRFRSADVTSYLSVKELFNGEAGDVLYLSRNFRSTPEMNGWFNRVFTELLPEDTEDQRAFEGIPLPGETPEDDGTFGGVYTYGCSAAKNAGANELGPQRTAEIIRRLVHDPQFMIKKAGRSEPEEISYGDFMLITPTKTKLADYTSVFSEYRIPFRVEGRIDFKDCPALRTLVNIYRAVAIPEDAGCLYGALTDHPYGMDRNELLRLREQGLVLNIFSANEKIPADAPVRGYLEEIRDLHLRSLNLSPSAVFDMILEHYDVFRLTGTANMEYVYFALEMLRTEENSGEIASPADGAAWLQKLFSDELNIERCVRLSRQSDCVHIANLHKVKGLEAPIVILAPQEDKGRDPEIRIEQAPEGAKGWVFRVKNKALFNSNHIKTAAYPDEKARESDSLSAEKKRLLYVAATRAGKALIIGELLKADGTRKDNNYWDFFAARAQADIFELTEGAAVYDPPEVCESATDIYAEGGSLDLSADGPRAKSFGILRPSVIRTKALTSSEDELDDAQDEDVRTDRRKRNPALAGTIVHRLMEMLVSSGNRTDLDAAVLEIARDYEAEDTWYTDILRKVGNTVRNGGFLQESGVPQDILNELLSADETHCEVPFCYREPGSAKIWHGVMDVLYKKDGQWHIIDYKTNADPSDLDEKYKEQMDAYISAFREMTGEEADARVYHIDVL